MPHPKAYTFIKHNLLTKLTSHNHDKPPHSVASASRHVRGLSERTGPSCKREYALVSIPSPHMVYVARRTSTERDDSSARRTEQPGINAIQLCVDNPFQLCVLRSLLTEKRGWDDAVDVQGIPWVLAVGYGVRDQSILIN